MEGKKSTMAWHWQKSSTPGSREKKKEKRPFQCPQGKQREQMDASKGGGDSVFSGWDECKRHMNAAKDRAVWRSKKKETVILARGEKGRPEIRYEWTSSEGWRN